MCPRSWLTDERGGTAGQPPLVSARSSAASSGCRESFDWQQIEEMIRDDEARSVLILL
jgi:hypothetical protein